LGEPFTGDHRCADGLFLGWLLLGLRCAVVETRSCDDLAWICEAHVRL